MSAPKRIQRKRTKGWRMPERAVSVARPGRWGSPYVIGSAIRDEIDWIAVKGRGEVNNPCASWTVDEIDWIAVKGRGEVNNPCASWTVDEIDWIAVKGRESGR